MAANRDLTRYERTKLAEHLAMPTEEFIALFAAAVLLLALVWGPIALTLPSF